MKASVVCEKEPASVLPEHVWHAGRTHVTELRLADRTEGENAANSGLGLFCASRPHDYILGFGPHIYRLRLVPNLRVLSWTIGDLARWGQNQDHPDRLDRAWFVEEGHRLAASFDIIALHELSGFMSQVIVLTDQAIAEVCPMKTDEFKRVAYDVKADLNLVKRL